MISEYNKTRTELHQKDKLRVDYDPLKRNREVEMNNRKIIADVLKSYDEDLFFANQIITNACATQAILAILLNNDDKVEVGPEITELKSFTKLMDPELRGIGISNCEKIRTEHNKFFKNDPFVVSKRKAKNEEEADEVFHFVSYINFKKLYL